MFNKFYFKEKTMDRRIQKTRKVIMETLVELMSRKDFEKITINEIAEGANVNRGTIYLHFVDKYDLLNQCVESSLTQLAKYCEIGMAEGVSQKESIESTFEYMEEHAFLYKTLLNNNGVTAFRNKLMDILLLSIGKQMDIGGMKNIMKNDILIQFIASGTVGVMVWWITNSMPYSAKDVTEQVWELLERNQMIPDE